MKIQICTGQMEMIVKENVRILSQKDAEIKVQSRTYKHRYSGRTLALKSGRVL